MATRRQQSVDSDLERQFMDALRAEEGAAGNVTLQRRLAWDEETYWRIRDQLVDRGRLRLGRGRGGSVAIVDDPPGPVEAESTAAPVAAATHFDTAEAELYEPVAGAMGQWARDNRFNSFHVERTARQGRRSTGGTWTRPDLVVAGMRVFQYLPQKHLEVVAFELKPSWAVSVTAVYEALAHRRRATMAYVWLHVPSGEAEALEKEIERIADEAKSHGIGLIVATDPGRYETWDTLVTASRVQPDPAMLNDFIAQQFAEEARNTIVQWIR